MFRQPRHLEVRFLEFPKPEQTAGRSSRPVDLRRSFILMHGILVRRPGAERARGGRGTAASPTPNYRWRYHVVRLGIRTVRGRVLSRFLSSRRNEWSGAVGPGRFLRTVLDAAAEFAKQGRKPLLMAA